MRQTSFFKNKEYPKEFGGELLKNKRKSSRPLSTKKGVHNVLRADIKTGYLFLKQRNQICSVIEKFAQQFNVKIYKLALARDHAHMLTKFEKRENYINFIRAVTGVLAKLLEFKWLYRPYTRVVEWGRDFKTTFNYIVQNELEGWGVIPHQPRKTRYSPAANSS